tara:strand:+ start:305 stop:550 length:246 start_codon:yes stop_codon:yes gene_type:complete
MQIVIGAVVGVVALFVATSTCLELHFRKRYGFWPYKNRLEKDVFSNETAEEQRDRLDKEMMMSKQEKRKWEREQIVKALQN